MITECIRLGDTTSLTMLIDGRKDSPLAVTVSTHAADRNRLAAGEEASVSLLAAGIHIMSREAG